MNAAYKKHTRIANSSVSQFNAAKFHMQSIPKQQIRSLFSRILQRYPRVNEAAKLEKRIQYSDLDHDGIINELCNSDEYKRLNIPSILCKDDKVTALVEEGTLKANATKYEDTKGKIFKHVGKQPFLV